MSSKVTVKLRCSMHMSSKATVEQAPQSTKHSTSSHRQDKQDKQHVRGRLRCATRATTLHLRCWHSSRWCSPLLMVLLLMWALGLINWALQAVSPVDDARTRYVIADCGSDPNTVGEWPASMRVGTAVLAKQRKWCTAGSAAARHNSKRCSPAKLFSKGKASECVRNHQLRSGQITYGR
jgi:hypothetical protein